MFVVDVIILLLIIALVIIITASIPYKMAKVGSYEPPQKVPPDEKLDDFPQYSPYYDVGLSTAIVNRIPDLATLIKSANVCQYVNEIPQQMMVENTKRMLQIGHHSQKIHDFAIGAQFVSNFKQCVCLVIGQPACDLTLWHDVSPLTYIFCGWPKADVQPKSVKRYYEISNDAISAVNSKAARYFIIENAKGYEKLANLTENIIILCFGEIPVDAILLSRPIAYCYKTIDSLGVIKATKIYTPCFGKPRELSPWVAVHVGDTKDYDTSELHDRLFYYDVAHRSYGHHTNKYIGIGSICHCGDCAIFCKVLEDIGWPINIDTLNKIDKKFKFVQTSHKIRQFGTVTEIIDSIPARIVSYTLSQLSLSDIKPMEIDIERAYSKYLLYNQLVEVYDERVSSHIMRCLIFAEIAGFNVKSMDYLYYRLRDLGLHEDCGSIIKNVFRITKQKPNIRITNNKIIIGDREITMPNYYNFSLIDYARYYMDLYGYSHPTFYDDPQLIKMINDKPHKNKVLVSYSPLVTISGVKWAKEYHLCNGDNIPVEYPQNTLVMFVTHYIASPVKTVYHDIWQTNGTAAIIIQKDYSHFKELSKEISFFKGEKIIVFESYDLHNVKKKYNIEILEINM